MDNKSNITFKPAKTQRASDVIYQQIYQKIISGELKTGDRLPAERELCEQFGRSRPSIREALRMLQQDGLIKITVGVNGGAIVQGISLESAEQPLRQLIDVGAITLQELVDYRSYNDYCCGQLAVQYCTEEDLAELKKIIAQYNAEIEKYTNEGGNFNGIEQADIEFHRTLAHSSHNKLCILMTDVVTALCTSMFWSKATTDMSEEDILKVNREAYENHAAIVDAIEAKDVNRLTHLMNLATNLFNDVIKSVL